MIKFEGTFDILGDATNQTANHNNMGSGDESRRKRLPVTAHPSKPKPQNGDGSLPEESDPTDACISQVSSVSISIE